MLNLELPWPPSINHYWRHTKNGHYISDKGKIYRHIVFSQCFNSKLKFLDADKLFLTIDAYPPDNRKRDLDNILKSLLDALQHAGIYTDDSNIDKILITRHKLILGKVRIIISKII